MGSGDPSVTSAPYTATASGGGQVTIPQGSTIANIAPTLTNFQQQPIDWGNLLKGIVGQVVGGYKAGGAPTGGGVPTAGIPAGGGVAAPPAPGGGVIPRGQAPQIPTMLGSVDPIALKATALMLKNRLMGF